MSLLIDQAFADLRECRAEFDLVLWSRYEAAAEACRDRLRNARAERAGIDPVSLFLGPAIRAYAYASPELIEHWEAHPRLTFAEFEAQWIRNREEARR